MITLACSLTSSSPPVGYLPLVPGIRPNTWIVDEVLTEVVPDNTQPIEWKEPKI